MDRSSQLQLRTIICMKEFLKDRQNSNFLRFYNVHSWIKPGDQRAIYLGPCYIAGHSHPNRRMLAAQWLQSCLTLHDHIDYSPPGCSGNGVLQACWSGLPCPPTGDLPNPGIKPISLMSSTLASGFFTTSATWEGLNKRMLLLSRFSRVRLCATP